MTRVIIAALIVVLCATVPAEAEQVSAPSFDSDTNIENVPEDSKSEGTPPQSAEPQYQSAPVADVDALNSVPSSGPTAYRIGAQDIIEISVFKVPELSKTLQVAESGFINFPLLGEVPAAGKTPAELEHYLTARLGAKYLQNPVVTVFVKEYNSQRVTVSGAVQKPGVYPIRGKTSLLQVLAIAGGLQEKSDSTVLVMRQEGDKRKAARFDVSQIESGRAVDPALQANDVVVAGTSVIKQTWGRFLRALPVAGTFALF